MNRLAGNAATKQLAGPNLLRLRGVAGVSRATVAAEYSLAAGCCQRSSLGSVHLTPPLIDVQPLWFAMECSEDVLYPAA